MTNFESWKQGLTLSRFVEMYTDEEPCRVCPALKLCEEKPGMGCGETIAAWGNQIQLIPREHQKLG